MAIIESLIIDGMAFFNNWKRISLFIGFPVVVYLFVRLSYAGSILSHEFHQLKCFFNPYGLNSPIPLESRPSEPAVMKNSSKQVAVNCIVLARKKIASYEKEHT